MPEPISPTPSERERKMMRNSEDQEDDVPNTAQNDRSDGEDEQEEEIQQIEREHSDLHVGIRT